MSDTTHTIWRSAAHFFSGTMVSRFSGMFRDMAMAYAFGTQSAVAALLVAFRFAHLLRRLLGEGAMQTALIPHFEELRTIGPKRAAQFFRDLTASLSIIIIALTAFIMLGIAALLHTDLLSPGNKEIAWLTFVMMPSLWFICLFGINASLLQCEKNYFAPSAAPIFFNLIWIVGVACTYRLPSDQAMTILSLFIIGGCCAQWLTTVPRVVSHLHRFELDSFWRIKLFSPDVVRLAKPLTLGIVGIAASQINNALDAVFARWASEEGPAILWYAIRLQQLPLALFGIALAGALLPPLSRAAKANDHEQYSRFLSFSFHRTLLFTIPITALLIVTGDRCVALLYGHGTFDSKSVVATTEALWGYSLGLIPMALVLVQAPAYYAVGDYKTPSIASAASMALNASLNYMMIGVFGLGPTSIAVATSISSWFNVAWLAIGNRKTKAAHVKWMKIALASIVAAAGVELMDHYLFGNSSFYMILNGQIPVYGEPILKQLVQLTADGVAFLGIFIVIHGLKD